MNNNQRTFEFRAFYKPDLELREPMLFSQEIIEDELFFVYKLDPDIKYPFSFIFMDDDWIVQQFTGLLDKNGRKIFEGDILHREHFTDWEVFFYEVSFCGKNVSDWNSRFVLEKHDVLEREIIGNIFENPNLIKV